MAEESELTVAVTGPTGTFGFGLIPRLEADDRVAEVVGIARRPFDPAEHGWSKMEYRQGDVRDRAPWPGLRRGRRRRPPRLPDHGTASRRSPATSTSAARSTPSGPRPAGCAAVRLRLVGGGLRLPRRQPRRDDRGVADPSRRPALLRPGEGRAGGAARGRGRGHPDVGLYLLRPPIVLGPHAMGAKDSLPGPSTTLGRTVAGAIDKLPFALPCSPPTCRPAHPRGRRGPGPPAVRGRGRPARGVQHRRRRHPHHR